VNIIFKHTLVFSSLIIVTILALCYCLSSLFDSDVLWHNSVIIVQNSVTCWFLSHNNISMIAVDLHCIIHVTG